MAIHVCCNCMFQMFHLFQTYVASVLSGCCICCSRYTLMLQMYISNVSPVSDVCCSKCFILWVFSLAGAAAGGGHRCRWSPLACTGTGAQHRSEAKCAATGTGLRAYVQQHVGAGGQAHSCSYIRDGRGRCSIRPDSATCGVGARAGQAQASGRSDASHTLVTRSPSFLKVF